MRNGTDDEDGKHVILPVAGTPDHAVMPVMMPRYSDSDMCRDGYAAACGPLKYAVDEHGRMHCVPDLESCRAGPTQQTMIGE